MNEQRMDMSTAGARSQAYGRLAEVFCYPEKGKEALLLAVEYTSSFDPAACKTACSLREYNYSKDIHSTALYEELIRFYQFFGLKRSPSAQMPDHITVEFEFMQFLSELENKATERNEDITSLLKAQRDFLNRHLFTLLHGIKNKLDTDSDACKTLVDISVELVNNELARIREIVGLGDAIA